MPCLTWNTIPAAHPCWPWKGPLLEPECCVGDSSHGTGSTGRLAELHPTVHPCSWSDGEAGSPGRAVPDPLFTGTDGQEGYPGLSAAPSAVERPKAAMQDACVHRAAGISLPAVPVPWPAASPGRGREGGMGPSPERSHSPHVPPPGHSANRLETSDGASLEIFGVPGALLPAQRDPKGLRQEQQGTQPTAPTAHPPGWAPAVWGSPVPEDSKASQGTPGFRNCCIQLSPHLQRVRNFWAFPPPVSANPALQDAVCGAEI